MRGDKKIKGTDVDVSYVQYFDNFGYMKHLRKSHAGE